MGPVVVPGYTQPMREKKLRASDERMARWEQAASGSRSFNEWAGAALDAMVDAVTASRTGSSERQAPLASPEAAKQEDPAPDEQVMPASECPRKRFHRRNVWCKTCGQVG